MDRIDIRGRQRQRMSRMPGIIVTVERCPRCGQRHEELGILPAEKNGPGKLRGGETHYAPCPNRPSWGVIWFKMGWEPVDTPNDYRLVQLEVS